MRSSTNNIQNDNIITHIYNERAEKSQDIIIKSHHLHQYTLLQIWIECVKAEPQNRTEAKHINHAQRPMSSYITMRSSSTLCPMLYLMIVVHVISLSIVPIKINLLLAKRECTKNLMQKKTSRSKNNMKNRKQFERKSPRCSSITRLYIILIKYRFNWSAMEDIHMLSIHLIEISKNNN